MLFLYLCHSVEIIKNNIDGFTMRNRGAAERRQIDPVQRLSNAKAQSANFPFCTIEPNVGVITVPDERIVNLVKIDNPKKTIPTTIEIVDIAGLVKGGFAGRGSRQ